MGKMQAGERPIKDVGIICIRCRGACVPIAMYVACSPNKIERPTHLPRLCSVLVMGFRATVYCMLGSLFCDMVLTALATTLDGEDMEFGSAYISYEPS